MPEKEIIANGYSFWLDAQMWSMIGLFVMGLIARTLVSNDPFDARRFFGEMILTAIGAVALYAAGLLQDMSYLQMIVFGCLGSLGGLRAVEWVIKGVVTMKAKT